MSKNRMNDGGQHNRIVTDIFHYANGEYMEMFLREVRRDIRKLKAGMRLPKFERDFNELFQYLVAKYQESYCKSSFYDNFSDANKERYLYLRGQIDEILLRKDQPFSDDMFKGVE